MLIGTYFYSSQRMVAQVIVPDQLLIRGSGRLSGFCLAESTLLGARLRQMFPQQAGTASPTAIQNETGVSFLIPPPPHTSRLASVASMNGGAILAPTPHLRWLQRGHAHSWGHY